jgi:hypothetical protein
MRALSIFVAATALLTTVSVAQAESGSVQFRRASAEQMEQVRGTYQLSDGRRAELLVLNGQLYAKIAQGARKEVLLAEPNRLASRDGTISIQFSTDFDSDRIVLEHGRNIGTQDTIRFAANDRPGRGGAD